MSEPSTQNLIRTKFLKAGKDFRKINDKCHFCRNENNIETIKHLFYFCIVIDEMETNLLIHRNLKFNLKKNELLICLKNPKLTKLRTF